jgi:hypothetical protein
MPESCLPVLCYTHDCSLCAVLLHAQIDKYRRSGIPVGSRVLHPGATDDFISGEHLNKVYGATGDKEDTSWRSNVSDKSLSRAFVLGVDVRFATSLS